MSHSGTQLDTSVSNLFMITNCAGLGQWDISFTETIFVKNVFVLLKILIPVAICVYTWKVCQTDRDHHRTSTLGLEETHE